MNKVISFKSCGNISNLIRLKQNTLRSVKNAEINPYLVAEFKKAVKLLAKDWKSLEKLFTKGLCFFECADEIMCYTIVASKLKEELLTKDFEFINQLCIFLLETKNPTNFSLYAEVICQKFYDLMFTIDQKGYNYYYNDLLDYLFHFDLLNLSKEQYHEIITCFHTILGYSNYILFFPDSSLEDIYNVLTDKLINNQFLFTANELIALDILKNIINSRNEELKDEVRNRILAIDSSNNNERHIIKTIIDYLLRTSVFPKSKLVRVNFATRKEP